MITDEDGRLDAAVEQGIITAEQAMAIRALAPHVGRPPREIDRPPQRTLLQASAIAYTVGAITVVVAMFWFLSDRWQWLGPSGILAACAVYAALFVLAARVLHREGFPVAAGLAITLAVIMAGPAAIALNDLMHLAPEIARDRCYYPDFRLWSCRGEELLAEGAVLLAALFALSRTRFPLLVGLITGILLRGVFHLTDGLYRNALGQVSAGWTWVLAGSLALAVAYQLERRQRGDVDFALWVHLAAAFCAVPATMQLLDAYSHMRHLMVPSAFVAFAAALLLRRFVYVPLGMVWVVWYLGWLAREVFRDSPAFPLLMAALGLGVIVATVWVQRNAERLTARFGTVTTDGRPRFPGGVALLLAPAVVALLQLPDAIENDRAERMALDWQRRQFERRMERERQPQPSAPPATRETAPRDKP